MKIGLISDTHGYLDPSISEHFKSCDLILHAGDVGDAAILTTLASWKPTQAVFGNIDGKEVREQLEEDAWVDCEEMTWWMTHIAGSPPHYTPEIRKTLDVKKADVLVCGHSHILKVMKDKKNNLLYVNPGAAGHHGFHTMRTVLRIEVSRKVITKVEVIELGKRGKA